MKNDFFIFDVSVNNIVAMHELNKQHGKFV